MTSFLFLEFTGNLLEYLISWTGKVNRAAVSKIRCFSDSYFRDFYGSLLLDLQKLITGEKENYSI